MSVLGIDIGTSYCVLATIQRGAVTIVRNDLSERLTPALVSFTEKERLIGEAAQTQIHSNFRNTARNLKQLLGCTSASGEDFIKETQFSLAQLEFVDGFACYRVRYKGEEQVMSGIRCMAALLTKLREIGERGTGTPIHDVVVSVPGWFSEISRQAMLDATEIAGLNCLRLLNEHAATALDYGIYRSNTFDSVTASRVAFIGIGHGSSNVLVADYVKGELRVVAVGNDRSIGGRDFDREVMKHFAHQFESKYKVNPLTNAKAVLKLEEAANRAKKMVSANSEAPFNIECLIEDYDLHGLLTRQTFEELCRPYSDRLVELLRSTFESNGISPDSVHHVEIVGGSTRVPWVQETIVNFFGNRLPLSKTLNMDEAVARGCALQAAMLTPRYRVREFTVVDRLFEPVTVSWLVGDEMKSSVLFDTGSLLGTKKWLTFQRHSGFEIRLTAGLKGQPLISFIEIPKDVAESANRRIKIRARLSLNGIASWEIAQLLIDEVEKENRSAVVNGDHAMANSETQQQQQQQEGGPPPTAEQATQSQQQQPSQEAEVVKPRARRLECAIQSQSRAGYLNQSDKLGFRDSELSMTADDRQQQEAREMMNTFESYIYSMRNKLRIEQLGDFASPDEIALINEKLMEYENWIFDNPEGSAQLYASKLAELKIFGSPVEERQIERIKLNHALEELSSTLSLLRASLTSPDFAHVETARLQTLATKIGDVDKWMQQSRIEIEKTALYEDVKHVKAKDITNESEMLKNFAKTILVLKPVEPKQQSKPDDNNEVSTGVSGEQSTTTTDAPMSPETSTNDVPM